LSDLLGIRAGEGMLTALLKRGIYNAVQRAGYFVVPYIAPDYVELSGGDLVTLIENGEGEEMPDTFGDAHLMIEIGMSIAMGNGRYEASEIRQLSYILERNFVFTELEIRALTALKE
jgi:hypothetical protein